MNCKKGDLAVVIFVAGETTRPNVGRIVRVVERNEDREYPGYGSIACWNVRSEGTPMTNSSGYPLMEGNMPDIALRPIRQLEEKEKEVRKEEIEA
jgi:hypothetical protein